MTGLFSSRIRISVLVLSGDKRSCMLPILCHGHIAFLGMVQRYGMVWYGTKSHTIPHTIPLTSTCTIYSTVLLTL